MIIKAALGVSVLRFYWFVSEKSLKQVLFRIFTINRLFVVNLYSLLLLLVF